MFRSNKTNNRQPAQGTRVARLTSESGLVDVTFGKKRHDQSNALKGARSDERKPARTANPGASSLAEDESMPAALTGISWARSGALKHAGMAASPKRPQPPRNRRLRWIRRLLIIVPLLLALVFGLHALLTASYFQVHRITVEGTRNAQLLTAIQRLHLEGVNIFLADTSADATRIKTLPPVADASVTRSLPDTLIVHIVERQPVLIWQVGAALYSVDANGAIIAQVQQADGLSVVTDDHTHDQRGHSFAPGGKIDPQIVQMARQLLEQIPTATDIPSFTLQDTLHYGLVLLSADGWQARFGGPDHLDNKIKELAAILQLVKRQGQQLALVDLRFGFYPYYRLKSPGVEP